jgi:hypothetical protein
MIFLLIVLIIIFVFLIYIYYFPKRIKNVKLHELNYFLENVKNGDLLFFSGSSPSENMIKWYTDSKFSHVAMCIIENNDVYIVEADIGQQSKEGVRVIPFLKKIKHYKGVDKIFGWRQMNIHNLPNIKERIIESFKKQFNKKLDNSMLSYVFKRKRTNNDVFCSEFICNVFCDITNKKSSTQCNFYSPKDFEKNVKYVKYVKY